MYFYVDEAGNTGNNLFDSAQPRLSYGVLSSLRNADVLCSGIHKKIQCVIGEKQIHANQLGFCGLVKIAPYLIEIQSEMKFDFDYYFIEKPDYALVHFFDAVFDAGLNDAVKWDTYWTPLRYLIIHKLSAVFDEPLLRESWRLCTAKKIEHHKDDIVGLLCEVKSRVEKYDLDARSIEIISDALGFGIANPLSLDFGHSNPKMISPNAVGFQFVVSSIARRLRKKSRKKAMSIIVDRQHQFNGSQIGTHQLQRKISEGIRRSSQQDKNFYLHHPLFATLDKADVILEGLTDKEITVCNSADSIGLQIVDVYLWIANKMLIGESVPEELRYLWSLFFHRSSIDGISLAGMEQRFMRFERMLPTLDDLTDEQRHKYQEIVDKHREKVLTINQTDE